MRCYICDKEISDKEIVYNEEMKAYEPCPVCLDEALDAAFSDGFSIDDGNEVIEPYFVFDNPELGMSEGSSIGEGGASDIPYVE